MNDPSEKKLTRRRFLKTTSTALVGGAVLGSLSLENNAALAGSEGISLERKGEVVTSVSSEGIKTAFLQL